MKRRTKKKLKQLIEIKSKTNKPRCMSCIETFLKEFNHRRLIAYPNIFFSMSPIKYFINVKPV